MKVLARVVLSVALGCSGGGLAVAQTQGGAKTFDFEGLSAGAASVCASGLTGGGKPVDWRILDDESAPNGPRVVSEVSEDTTSNRFALCIFPDVAASDVDVTTKFKAVSGTVDQAAGLMVRVLDQDNYYVARANALEDNVRFYRVVGGQREQIEGARTKVTPGEWHTLGLRAQGDRFTVSFDGQVLFITADRTFQESGNIGLWTKADSVTHFDQVEIDALD